MTTPADYRSRIRLQARALRNPRTGAVVKRFMTSWPALAETQMEAAYFGDELGEETGGFLGGENVVKKKVTRLTEGLSADSAKMHAILDYVRSSIEWNGELWRSREQDFDEILTSKTGNSAEVNLLLVSMLRLAGVEAHPVMISTRDHGKVLPLYPILDQFNSVIATVELPGRGERTLLDATEPLCPASLLPKRDLNRQGWLVRKEKPSWIEIPRPSETGRRIYVRGTLTPDGTLDGQLSVRDQGYSALDTRRTLQEKEPSAFVNEHLLDHLTGVSVSDESVQNRDTLRRPLRTTAAITSPEYARSTGTMLYLKPRLVPAVEENPFKRKERSFPVDFPHPEKVSYVLALRLPDGYQVKDTPDNLRIKLPKDEGSFTRLIRAQGRQLMVRSTMEVTASQIPPKRYDALRAFYTRIVSAQSDQIVLEKVGESTASSGTSGHDE
jgi:hypothetical protein